MARWARNRIVPCILTLGNMAFWLCLRIEKEAMEQYAFLSHCANPWVQVAAFFILGITLVWALYACRPKRPWPFALGMGIGFVGFQWAYNLLCRRQIYQIHVGHGLISVAMGVILGRWLLTRENRHQNEITIAKEGMLEILSAQRERLMGLAMLYVMLFHSGMMQVHYVTGLRQFVEFGFAGVDLFLFLSGLGITRSLSKDSRILPFYVRRARRIYPEAIPWVGIYSLIGVFVGHCTFPLLIANCLGFGYWISRSSFAYNWYYSAILLFYLLAPFAYRLLRREETRSRSMALLLALSLLSMLALTDVLHRTRPLMALSRFPVFLAGMCAGFWLQEGKGLTRTEYRSLLPLAALFMVLSLVSSPENFPMPGYLWLCSGIAMALASLPIAHLLGHLRNGSVPARFLTWVGRNSLSLYLCNILLGRLYDLAVDLNAGSNLRRFLCAYGIIAANLLIVLLIRRARDAWQHRTAR